MIPHALGQNVTFEAGEGPRLDWIRDLDALKRLSMDYIHESLGPIYKTVSRFQKNYPWHCSDRLFWRTLDRCNLYGGRQR